MKPQKAFREYADKLDEIENEYSIKAKVHQGSACLHEKTIFDFADCNFYQLYSEIDESSFIGIMPNQWRPEIHLKIKFEGIPLRFYSFVAHGFNNYDGGFIDEYSVILSSMTKYGAPDWAIKKLISLYEECLSNSKKEKLQKELSELQSKKSKVEKELSAYK